jgi:hypothetical protein
MFHPSSEITHKGSHKVRILVKYGLLYKILNLEFNIILFRRDYLYIQGCFREGNL